MACGFAAVVLDGAIQSEEVSVHLSVWRATGLESVLFLVGVCPTGLSALLLFFTAMYRYCSFPGRAGCGASVVGLAWFYEDGDPAMYIVY